MDYSEAAILLIHIELLISINMRRKTLVPDKETNWRKHIKFKR
jgi:hypothetical protein